MNASEIKSKYCMDVKLSTPSVTKMGPEIVSAALKSIAGGKAKAIPREYIMKVADNAMEWARKNGSFTKEWSNGTYEQKKALIVRVFKEYITKFKWSIAEGMKKYGVFDSVDVMDNYSKYVEVQSKIDDVSFKFKPLVNELISIGMKKSAAALKGIVNSINDGDFARLMSKEKKEVIGK